MDITRRNTTASGDLPSNIQEDQRHELPNNYQDEYDDESGDDYESFEMIYNDRIEEEEVFKKRLMYVKHRWYALTLQVFIIFGSYFCYDNPSELEERIQKKFNVSQTQYSLLYSSYSMPNMIVPVCGGLILSKIGKGWGLLMFSLIITLGQIICAFGGWFECYLLLVIGRGIHGLGGESQQMVNAVYVVHWFREQEISFAMGVSQMTLLVSFLGGWLIPLIAKESSIGNAFGVGALSCLLSLIVAIVLIWLDNKATKNDKAMWKKRREEIKQHNEKKGIEMVDIDYEALEREREAQENSFKWEELLVFEKGFWLMAFDCLLHFALIETCVAIGTDLMKKNYGWSNEENGMFITVPYLVCGIFLAPIGFFVDKFGRRQTIVISSGFSILTSFIIYLTMPKCDRCYTSIVPWFLLGYSLTVYYVLMFGGVSHLVRDSQTGTAYGFITCFQNIGTTFLPPLIGYIHDSTKSVNNGYFWTMIAFIIFGILSICVKITLYRWDKQVRGGILESSNAQQDFSRYLEEQNLQSEQETQQFEQQQSKKKQINESLLEKNESLITSRYE